MNPIDLYRTATTRAIEVADGIQPDQLASPTPCSEWTVRDLLDHLVGGTGYLLGRPRRRSNRPADRCDSCRPGRPAWQHASDASPTPRHWNTGPAPRLGSTGRAWRPPQERSMDVLVHTWDLASATGQDTDARPGRRGRVHRHVPAGHARARPGRRHHRPRDRGAADASPQDRLLGALGRRP